MKKHYVLKNRKRFTLFITITILIFAFTIFTPHVQGYNERTYETVTVAKGDTLWDIAIHYNSSSTDVRKLIYDIKKINNLSSSCIREGDIIKIPLK